jgi:hypothetical protein
VMPAADTLLSPELMGSCLGLYYHGLDQVLQPQLERQGRWEGRGCAVAIDAFRVFATMSETNDDALRKVVGLVLHEIAHWADFLDVELAAVPYDTFVAKCHASEVRRENVSAVCPDTLATELVTHGESFIRICAHLWHRCRKHGGIVLGPQYLNFGNTYKTLRMLHSPVEYLDALSEELNVLEKLSFAELAQVRPPMRFTELWNESLARVFPNHFTATTEVLNA